MQDRHEVQNSPCSYMLNKIDGPLISSLRECEIPRYVIRIECHEVLKYMEKGRLCLISRKILRHFWRDWSSVYDVTLYRVWSTEMWIDGGCEELSVDKHPHPPPPSPCRRTSDFYLVLCRMFQCASFGVIVAVMDMERFFPWIIKETHFQILCVLVRVCRYGWIY